VVVLVVVPGEELAAERQRLVERREAAGEFGLILERFELAFRASAARRDDRRSRRPAALNCFMRHIETPGARRLRRVSAKRMAAQNGFTGVATSNPPFILAPRRAVAERLAAFMAGPSGGRRFFTSDFLCTTVETPPQRCSEDSPKESSGQIEAVRVFRTPIRKSMYARANTKNGLPLGLVGLVCAPP